MYPSCKFFLMKNVNILLFLTLQEYIILLMDLKSFGLVSSCLLQSAHKPLCRSIEIHLLHFSAIKEAICYFFSLENLHLVMSEETKWRDMRDWDCAVWPSLEQRWFENHWDRCSFHTNSIEIWRSYIYLFILIFTIIFF